MRSESILRIIAISGAVVFASLISRVACAIDLGPEPACVGQYMGIPSSRILVEYVSTQIPDIGGGLARMPLGKWSTIDLRHPPRCYGTTPCPAAIPPGACAAVMSLTGTGMIGTWPESIAVYVYFRRPGSDKPCTGSMDGEYMVTRQETGTREVLGQHIVPVVDGKIEMCIRGVTNMKPDGSYIGRNDPFQAIRPTPLGPGGGLMRAGFALNIGVSGWLMPADLSGADWGSVDWGKMDD